MSDNSYGSGYISPSLASLCIYVSKDVPEGHEEDKILFYYPLETQIDRQVKEVGLSEGLILFAARFSPKEPISVVHYEKSSNVLYNPEANFWMILKFHNPCISAKNKEGKMTADWKEDDISDEYLNLSIREIYRLFKLFCGPFSKIQSDYSEDILRKRFSEVMPKICENFPVEHSTDILGTLEGIQFFPVDKNVYLRIQSFVNSIELAFPSVRHTAVIFKHHLVWSGMNQEDIRIIYFYLSKFLLPSLQQHGTTNMPLVAANRNVKSGWILGPPPSQQNQNQNILAKVAVPEVYLSNHTEPHYLLVFTVKDLLLVFVVQKNKNTEQPDFYSNLTKSVNTQIESLMAALPEPDKKVATDESFRYIYFNHMNFALKTTVNSLTFTHEIWKIISDMHRDFNASQDPLSETVVRTQTDKWIVGRKSDSREFYVIFENRQSSHFLNIHEEVRSLNNTHFAGIFVDNA